MSRGFSREYLIEVARGRIAGESIINKFGSVVSAADHASWKAITTTGNYPTPMAATALELVSDDNINDFHPDNAAGKIGAHTVRVYGLKTPTSLVEEFEDVKLNGTTAAALANSWWRVYRLKVMQSGTYASLGSPSHNSTITVQESGAGAPWGVLEVLSNLGLAQSEIGAVTIPKGQDAYLIAYGVDISNTNGNIDIAMAVREKADDIVTPYTGVMRVVGLHRNVEAGGDAGFNISNAPYGEFIGPADFGFLTKSNGNQAYEADVNFQLLCVPTPT